MTRLEHVNITVADPDATADLFCRLFDWHLRWSGKGMQTGRTVHVGGVDSYVALFSFGDAAPASTDSYRTRGALNHIAVVVDDLDQTERRIKIAGYVTENHANYEPGRRFYFIEENGIEIEVVSYS